MHLKNIINLLHNFAPVYAPGSSLSIGPDSMVGHSWDRRQNSSKPVQAVFIRSKDGIDQNLSMTAMLYLKSLISNTLKPTIQHLMAKIVLFMTSYWTCFRLHSSKCWYDARSFQRAVSRSSLLHRYGSDKNHIEIRFPFGAA